MELDVGSGEGLTTEGMDLDLAMMTDEVQGEPSGSGSERGVGVGMEAGSASGMGESKKDLQELVGNLFQL